MSPRKISNLAFVVAAISILGIIITVFVRPSWGLLDWWPAAGMVISFLMIIAALVKGALLATQKQTDIVEVMNDCNAGFLNSDNSR
jgi:hypothetical protein